MNLYIATLAALAPALACAHPPALRGSAPTQRTDRQLLHYGDYKAAKAQGDLPPLPPERAPNGSEWDNSVAICTSMHRENSTDIREWILYYKYVSCHMSYVKFTCRSSERCPPRAHLPTLPRHAMMMSPSRECTCDVICRWLGVDHIYVTENAPEASPEMTEQLRDFVEAGFVTYDVEPKPKAQMKVFYDCMKRAYTRYNWLAFFDADEFLVLRRCASAPFMLQSQTPVLTGPKL
jgi:hypothetical protein